MRVLGIDYGDRRIGISISDPFGLIAQGLETIEYEVNIQIPLDRIADIVKTYKVTDIVVGFPRNMNGTVGPRGEKTLEFIDKLKESMEDSISVVIWDERLSTVAANRIMNEVGIKRSKKKGSVDKVASVYILQGYLDSMKDKKL